MKISYLWFRLWDRFCKFVAFLLPHKIILWAIVRAGAYATSGEYAQSVPDKTSIVTVLDRWDHK